MARPRKVTYPHIPRFAADPPTILTADGAIPIDEDTTINLGKGSAGAFSVAAPGANRIGRILRLTNTTDFIATVTFTGSTLRDGTTGASITWTTTAFAGCSLTVQAVSATAWNVLAQNLGAIA